MSEIRKELKKIVMFSLDPRVGEKDSAVRGRLREQAALVSEFNVVILARTAKEREEREEALRVFTPGSRTKFGLFFWGLIKGASLSGDDWRSCVITAQDPFFAGLAAFWAACFSGASLELQLHTDIFSLSYRGFSLGNRLHFILAHFLLPKAAHIRVVSSRLKDGLLAWGVPEERITILPVFLDLDKFRNKAAAINLRGRYPQFEKIALWVGRLAPEKNSILAVEVLRELLKTGHKIGLIIIGEGSERPKLERLIKKFNLEDFVRLEGYQRDLVSYYKSADCLLVTSAYEGYGLAMAEAAACGLPIVATDVGIAREAGAMIAAAEPKELANAVSLIFEDEKENEKVSGTFCAQRFSGPQDKRFPTPFPYLETLRRAWEKTLFTNAATSANIFSPIRRFYHRGLKFFRENFPVFYNRAFPYRMYIKYIASGATAATVDLVFLFVLTELFGLYYLISVALAFIVAFFVSFTLQKFWTFRDGSFRDIHGQAFFYLALALINLGLNTFLVYFFVEIAVPRLFGLKEIIAPIYLSAQALASIILALESFFLSRYVIFKNGLYNKRQL